MFKNVMQYILRCSRYYVYVISHEDVWENYLQENHRHKSWATLAY